MKKIMITTAAVMLCCAMTGQAQTFNPIVEDSVDFVIEGTATKETTTVYVAECPDVKEHRKGFNVSDRHFRITIRQPLHKFMKIYEKDAYLR